MGTNGQTAAPANLSYTKFLFIVTHQNDDAGAIGKLRTAGATISRGFFNDYDADGTRDPQPQETIQFLQADSVPEGREGIAASRYALQLCANYRPRLDEAAAEFRKRINGAAEVIV